MSENQMICPEDVLKILLPASHIPSGSIVSKRTGEAIFVLAHDIKVYHDSVERGQRKAPMTIDGFFLVGNGSDITQIQHSKILCWHTTAQDFVELMRASWRGSSQ